MRGKGLAVTLYAWRRRTDLIGRATDRVDLTWSPRPSFLVGTHREGLLRVGSEDSN
jgi:hypothetical protein